MKGIVGKKLTYAYPAKARQRARAPGCMCSSLVPSTERAISGRKGKEMFKPAIFKALVHHIVARVEDPSQLGAVKLNKCVWFIDGQTYLRTGETLTGARYTKMPQGPVPKAMLPILRELQREGKIAVETVDYYGRGKRQYRLLQEPPTGTFDDEVLGYIHHITDIIAKNHTAASISELTHGAAWKLADDGEDLPFFAVLADDLQEVTAEDIAWARDRMEKFAVAA